MKRLVLCLAVTLGLCLGLGASANATPPPTATRVVAAPALVTTVPLGAATPSSTLTAGPSPSAPAAAIAEELATKQNVSFYGPDGQVVKGTMSTLGLVHSGVPLAEALDRTVPTAGASTQARITFAPLRVAVEFNRVETLNIGFGTAACGVILGRIPFWPVALIGAFCAIHSAVAAYYYARGWCSKVQSGFPNPTRLQHAAYDGGYCR